jgi:methylated-DNA-[protein]-cysteine S-methyltransferase
MIYTANYKSPVGNILLASKDNKLIGLWIEEQKYYLSNIKDEIKQCEDNKILIETMIWLDKYFNKEKPDIKELDLNPIGSDFRQEVWKILCDIPYGKVTTIYTCKLRGDFFVLTVQKLGKKLTCF